MRARTRKVASAWEPGPSRVRAVSHRIGDHGDQGRRLHQVWRGRPGLGQLSCDLLKRCESTDEPGGVGLVGGYWIPDGANMPGTEPSPRTRAWRVVADLRKPTAYPDREAPHTRGPPARAARGPRPGQARQAGGPFDGLDPVEGFPFPRVQTQQAVRHRFIQVRGRRSFREGPLRTGRNGHARKPPHRPGETHARRPRHQRNCTAHRVPPV